MKRFDAVMELFSERDLVELLQHGLEEAFADAVCLRCFDLGIHLVDVVDRQEEVIVVLVHAAAVFRVQVWINARSQP